MHKQVKFRDRQEHQAADHNNLQSYARATFDDLTRDAVTDDRKFAGFETTQTSSTEILVAPGRLYDTGRQFINEQSTPFNLLARLPVATKRKVAVVAWGVHTDTTVEPRDFLINADTGETEPQAVAMQELRRANLDIVAGVEGADPQPPQVSAETLVVAIITLGTTGILGIEMSSANRLENMEGLGVRVGALEVWRTQAGTRLETLASDLSGLANRQQGTAAQNLLETLMYDVARLREKLELPSTYTAYGADMMMNEEKSDVAKPGYDAKIDLGLRFPDAAQDIRLVQLFNPFNADVKVYGNGMMLPAHEHERRIEVPGFSDQCSLTEYQVSTWALVKNSHSRRRVRSGNGWRVWKGESKLTVMKRTVQGPNNEPPGSQYPVANMLFRKRDPNTGEFETITQSTRKIKHQGMYRHNKSGWYRSDWWSEPYWTTLPQNISADGAMRAQTFLNAQDGWASRIGLYFTTLGASGDVRVMLTELTEAGTPDMEAVVAETTLARANMKLYPLETTVEIGPAFLTAGRRYAIVLISQAAHWVALGDKLAYSGGSWFYSSDGAYFAGSQTDDLKFNLYYAKFSKTWLQVQLQPLSLAGGISDIDLLQEGWAPESTSMVYEVQKPGGQWIRIEEMPDDASQSILFDTPPLMNFRVTMSGTPDVMPAVNLAASQQTLTRPKTAFTHISLPINLPASSSTIKVKAIVDGYVEADHDLTLTVLAGAGETVETADAVVDEVIDGRLIRTGTFNLAAVTNLVRIKAVGATVEAITTFVVDEVSYIAL